MTLVEFGAKHYRCLLDERIKLGDLNIFIGANASGKSTVLDVPRFLQEGARTCDFRAPVYTRGGIVHLAWKGEAADRIELFVHVNDSKKKFEWLVRLVRDGYEFHVDEHVDELHPDGPPTRLLEASRGEGRWRSGERGARVTLRQAGTACALSAAAADASFPARNLAGAVSRWGFFDPNPFFLRRDRAALDAGGFDPYGRNLGETLYTLQKSSPDTLERIVAETKATVGLPTTIETRESERGFYFVQEEPGLQYPVHQMGVSSGTLRILALMTALHAEPETNLIGIEEPENCVHPTALSSFAERLLASREDIQFMVTTHSPMLLDFLNDPGAVRVVQHRAGQGTTILNQGDSDSVRKALYESGFCLGEFYETKGFGAG